MLNKFVYRSDSSVYRIIDGVAMIVSTFQGKLHTLNEVGTYIWHQADGNHTLSAIIDQICQEFDVDHTRAMEDAEAFIQQLVEKDMLLLSDTPITEEQQ